MKKKLILKFMGWATVIIVLAIGIFVISNWSHLREMPRIASSFYSRSFCSCYYVMKQSESYCHNFARQYIPITSFEHSRETKTVHVKSFGVESIAKYINHQNGCDYDAYAELKKKPAL